MKLKLKDIQRYVEAKQKIEDFMNTNKVIKIIASYDSFILEGFTIYEIIEKIHKRLNEISLTPHDELFNEDGYLVTYVAVRNPETKIIDIKKIYIYTQEVEK